MTKEFRISFQYRSRPYQARVVRNTAPGRVDYAVRPKATLLVREYGRQILIFKENGVFRCTCQVNLNSPEYVQALINAIQDQDHAPDTSLA